jgi:hypothetical protein
MEMDDIRRRARCCACGGPMRRSPHMNLVCLERKAEWKYPQAGNVLTGEGGQAVAIVCDRCLDDKATIVNAVEFRDGQILYHQVEQLAEIA